MKNAAPKSQDADAKPYVPTLADVEAFKAYMAARKKAAPRLKVAPARRHPFRCSWLTPIERQASTGHVPAIFCNTSGPTSTHAGGWCCGRLSGGDHFRLSQLSASGRHLGAIPNAAADRAACGSVDFGLNRRANPRPYRCHATIARIFANRSESCSVGESEIAPITSPC